MDSNGYTSRMRQSAPVCERFQEAADLVARRWTPLILQQLQDGPRRYSELVETLSMVSEKMLTQRLRDLTGAGLVERNVLLDEGPYRVQYGLTESGQALAKVVGGLQRWADQWIPAKKK